MSLRANLGAGIGSALGAGLGGGGRSALVRTLSALADRSWIAGRDGSIACTRATARRCVFSGAVLPNNTACYGVIPMPGLGPTRFYFAGPASTNRELYSDLRAAADWLGSGATKSTNGLYARFTEDTSNSSHRTTSSTLITPAGSSTYTFSFIVGPETTAPIVTATLGTAWSATRIVATANLATGAIGGVSIGGVYPLKDGSKLVSFTFTTIASPTANNIPIGMSITGAETYPGVGNFIDVKDVLLELSGIAGARIDTAGSAVTHNADEIDWTLPDVAPQNCEVWGIYLPFAWSAAAGAFMPGGAVPRMFAGDGDLWRYFTQNLFSGERRDDPGTQRVSSTTAGNIEARAHAAGSYFGLRTNGLYVTAYHGTQAAVGSAPGTLPWRSASSLRLGNRYTPTDRSIRGAVCLAVSPLLKPQERAALIAVSNTLPNLFLP